MTATKKELSAGDIVTYSYPGLISASGITTGKVIRVSRSGTSVLVEDIEIQKGETKLYQHWISKKQIQSK